jgi:N-acetylglutamate synthase
VRRIVGNRDGRPLFTDILGELVSFTTDELVVDGKNGHEVVPIAAVVAGKRIPPRRVPG